MHNKILLSDVGYNTKKNFNGVGYNAKKKEFLTEQKLVLNRVKILKFKKTF
jgi:hypothetical protein